MKNLKFIVKLASLTFCIILIQSCSMGTCICTCSDGEEIKEKLSKDDCESFNGVAMSTCNCEWEE